jgi:DNA-nicking Smr family endonuclease
MPHSRGLSEADRTSWQAYTRMVAPLRGRTGAEPATIPEPKAERAPASGPRPHVADQATKPRRMASPLTVGTQPGGIDGATWQRLRSGKLLVGRRLDLHGMTTQRAFHALVAFVRGAHADQVRCVEIITGRGGGETSGAIRREFPHWLNLPEIRPLILAASHPHAQNPGSVRLILRRIR